MAGAANAQAVAADRALGAPGRGTAGHAFGPRAGPSARPGPLGAPPGAGRAGPVLVASGGLVGAARTARGRGTTLRRRRRGRAAGLGRRLCTNPAGHRGLSVPGTVHRPGGREQHGTSSSAEKEIKHDLTGHHGADLVEGLLVGRAGPGGSVLAPHAHLGTVTTGSP